MKSYIDLCITCQNDEMAEICTAFLADYPFESFDMQPTEQGVELHAYILSESWAECSNEALTAITDYGTVEYAQAKEDENWNQRWEQESFHPVNIDNRIVIRAPHHPAPATAGVLDIIVAPQMSFGSGHHSTTRNMSLGILSTQCTGRALDVGCGTGVLSIVALKCGAKQVDALDIDPWSVESAKEAAELNGVTERMNVLLGTVEVVAGEKYDMVMANINRNIILQDLAHYVELLNPGGTLLLSGFLSADREDIYAATRAHDLTLAEEHCDAEWLCMKFRLN